MEFSVPGIVRGYHVYQRIWTPFVGERATTVREPDNEHDRYAVAVLEDETLCTVGHLPREISKECSFFIRRGGEIGVEVTGPRQKSTTPDKGMEIPTLLIFKHSDPLLLEKAKKLLEVKGFKDKPREDKPTPSEVQPKSRAEKEKANPSREKPRCKTGQKGGSSPQAKRQRRRQ